MSVIPFRKTYRPDPRNGEVYATECFAYHYENGLECETHGGFVVVHMSRSGDSAAVIHGFNTMEAAQAGAVAEAHKRNAVLA